MVDWRTHLSSPGRVILPYFGGSRVEDRSRSYRLDRETLQSVDLTPGWWVVAVEGRRGRLVERAEPVDLDGLPSVRGWWHRGYVFHASAGATRAERLVIPPETEPLAFTPLLCRRWYNGLLLPEAEDLGDGTEEAVRDRFDRGQGLAGVPGVAAALRAAYAWAVCARLASQRGEDVAPIEVLSRSAYVADAGSPAAEVVLEEARRNRILGSSTVMPLHTGHQMRPAETEEAADAALRRAGAHLTSTRRLAGGGCEVRFLFRGESWCCVVDPSSLQVLDAGICLQEHDRELTLDSLPSVLGEAMDTHTVHVTRWT